MNSLSQCKISDVTEDSMILYLYFNMRGNGFDSKTDCYVKIDQIDTCELPFNL